MSQFNSVLAKTLTAAGTIVAERFVSAAGAQISVAGNAAIGVARNAAAAGELVTVDMVGTAIIESGGAISAGVAVKSGADGRALTYDTGTKAGVALQAATGAGQRIEILLLAQA